MRIPERLPVDHALDHADLRLTLEDVRRETAAEAGQARRSREDLARAVDYQLLEALGERGRLGFLGIGRPEGRGCFCGVNRLLREAIAALASAFEVTVIDAEAGVEHVNRDVIGAVDHLLLVSDTSAKGLRVAETIVQVRDALDRRAAAGLLLNRVTGGAAEAAQAAARCSLPLVGWLPEDETVRRFDAEERSFLELPACPAQQALERVVAGLLRG